MSEVVLIVDDDPVQRCLLEGMVQRFGYQAITTDGGDAAVKLLTGPGNTRIDGVVLDLVMPDLDGRGVLARMQEAGINIPVIVQTAHGGIDNVVCALRAGATDFVVKPASPERLQVSLRNAFTNKALAGELQRLKRRQDGALTRHSLPLTDPRGDMRPLEDIEREAIRFAMSRYQGQMSEVARRLGIGRSTLYRKLKGLALEEDLSA